MLRRLADDGLVSRDDHKLIQFTDRGREVATRIVARHRTVEAYLVKVMGIPWDEVHEEAHAMEHSISPRLETKMLEMIGEVRTCPHGHPDRRLPARAGRAHPGRAGRQRAHRAAARERGRGDAALPEAARRRARAAATPWSTAAATATRRSPCFATSTADTTHEVDDRLARTVSVLVLERGDGPVSDVAEAGAELQLLGPTRWGM